MLCAHSLLLFLVLARQADRGCSHEGVNSTLSACTWFNVLEPLQLEFRFCLARDCDFLPDCSVCVKLSVCHTHVCKASLGGANTFPNRVLCLQFKACLFSVVVCNNSSDRCLWAVCSSISEVFSGVVAGFSSNHAEGDASIMLGAVSSVLLSSESAILYTHLVELFEISWVRCTNFGVLMELPVLCDCCSSFSVANFRSTESEITLRKSTGSRLAFTNIIFDK